MELLQETTESSCVFGMRLVKAVKKNGFHSIKEAALENGTAILFMLLTGKILKILLQLCMILNLSKIKTESLLLFCRDLILSYKDKVDLENSGVDKDIIENFNSIGINMLKEIKMERQVD